MIERPHIVVIERHGTINGQDAYVWRCSCGAVLDPTWAHPALAWVEEDAEAHQRAARRAER